jgi:hypothetical protein
MSDFDDYEIVGRMARGLGGLSDFGETPESTRGTGAKKKPLASRSRCAGQIAMVRDASA